MAGAGQGEAEGLHAMAEMGAVAGETAPEFVAGLEQIEDGQRGRRDHRRQAVGEQVRARALAQPGNDLPAPRRIAARGPAQGLAQGPGEDVDAALDAAMLGGAVAVLAHEADGVGIVDHDHGAVALGKVADGRKVGDDAVHGEDAVGGDEAEAAIGRGFQLAFQIGHVVVGVAQPPRLAKPHPVDDAGVVQSVADDGVVLAQQGLEQAAVGVETRRIEDGVLGPEEGAEASLQFPVRGLGAADEAHRGHAEAEAFEGLPGGCHQGRMVGQAEVIVGAEIQDLAAVVEPDGGLLGRGDDAFGLEKPGLAHGLGFTAQILEKASVHGFPPGWRRRPM